MKVFVQICSFLNNHLFLKNPSRKLYFLCSKIKEKQMKENKEKREKLKNEPTWSLCERLLKLN